jgi:hypothetical protein
VLGDELAELLGLLQDLLHVCGHVVPYVLPCIRRVSFFAFRSSRFVLRVSFFAFRSVFEALPYRRGGTIDSLGNYSSTARGGKRLKMPDVPGGCVKPSKGCAKPQAAQPGERENL